MNPVSIGIIGSQFQADCHAASIAMIPSEMKVVAVASPTGDNARLFAQRHGIAASYSDYRDLIAQPEIEAVSINTPNSLHCEMTLAAAAAGKHVICEKPLCVTLEEADQMIGACRDNDVLLMYAEELLFTP